MPLATHALIDHVAVPVAVAVMGFLLVYALYVLRGLLKEVRGELNQARQERDAERKIAKELRAEVARLRRVVSALIHVIADAGLPVPNEAYEVQERGL